MNSNLDQVESRIDYRVRKRMSHNFNYNSVLSLVSSSRIQSYRTTFGAVTDSELYSTYIWSQNAAGILYPLFQNAEVTLRNAIDIAAKRRFGDYWWDAIAVNANQQSKFHENIVKAKGNLTKSWRRKEATRRNIPIRSTGTPPNWSHDQIVAATDFSTWQYVLKNQFDNTNRQRNHNYLWPNSLGRAFKQYSIFSTNPRQARIDLMNLIDEIRAYRNRIFHHEPIWTKAANVVDSRTAIDTIRSKINKIEKLIKAIDNRKYTGLEKTGVFLNARRICSVEELNIYQGNFDTHLSTKKQKRTMRKAISVANKGITSAIKYDGNIFGFYKLK